MKSLILSDNKTFLYEVSYGSNDLGKCQIGKFDFLGHLTIWESSKFNILQVFWEIDNNNNNWIRGKVDV